MDYENDNQMGDEIEVAEPENEAENYENEGPENSEQNSIDKIGQLNEEKRQAEIAQEEATEQKKQAEEKEKQDMQPNAVNKITSNLLKSAWESLVASWGLTLIWIDIHVFSSLVFGNKMFCKLGMEWIPDALKQTQFKEAEKLGKVVGATEGIGVGCLNLGCLMLVLAAFIIIGIIFKILQHPLDALWTMPTLTWEVMKAIFKGV